MVRLSTAAFLVASRIIHRDRVLHFRSFNFPLEAGLFSAARMMVTGKISLPEGTVYSES